MFSIIFQGRTWENGTDFIDKRRVLECTADNLKSLYAPDGILDFEKVKELPTIFACESNHKDRNQVAHVGRITRIQLSGITYRIDYVCDGPIRTVLQKFLLNNKNRLHLTDWEFQRNHWAIKDVDLYQLLLLTQMSSPEEIGVVDRREAVEDPRWLLHEKIASGCWKMFIDGHYSSAVLQSMFVICAMTKEKSGQNNLDGVALMQEVFSFSNPKLVFSEMNSESGKNEQKGYLSMLVGAMAGIRNPFAHGPRHNLDAKSALQHLIFASMLASRIDEAVVMPVN